VLREKKYHEISQPSLKELKNGETLVEKGDPYKTTYESPLTAKLIF